MVYELTAQLPRGHVAEWVSKTIVPTRVDVDKTGKIIFEDGIKTYQYDGKSFQTATKSLSPDLGLELFLNKNPDLITQGKPIAYAELPDGTDWLSIENKGLYLVENNTLKQVSFLNGNVGRQILKLRRFENKVYICTYDQGLYSWDPSAYDLKSIYLLPEYNTAIYDVVKDKRGNLWLATAGGLLLKRDVNWESQIPDLRIEAIKLIDNDFITQELNLEESPKIILKPEENNIQFHFTGTHLLQSEKLEYEVRFFPIRPTWYSVGTNNMVQFSGLKPAQYQFEVKAFVDDQYAAFASAPAIDIEKSVPYKLWLYVFGGLALIGIIWFIAYRRSQNFIRKLEFDKEKVLTEKTLLQFQHKALQLQMNPHFVFNSFNSIQGLIASDRNQDARQYLNKFASLMRSILSHSTKDWIGLDEEVTCLKTYLEIEKLCRNDSFDFEFIFSEEVDPENIEVPPMIIQAFLENSIIHGFKNMEEKGHISVQFSFLEQLLTCEIHDNGLGLTHSTKTKKKNHESMAVNLITERLKKLTHINEPVIMEEKFSKDGTVKGTKVVLYLPYK
jgi:hypothetical protein